jgi:hypothetical protein
LVYKEMMVVSRFMVMIATALLIVASVSFDTLAATITYDPQPHYSSTGSPNHDNCENAGNQDMDCQGCCQGISCASSGVPAQVTIVAQIVLSISQPDPSVGDHLYGRSIAPETGPPKLPA